MKRKDLVELWQLMNQYKEIRSVKFAYFLAKNRKKIQPEIEVLEDVIKPPEAYTMYDNRRAKLAQFYSDRDQNDDPIIQNANYVITEKLNEFNDKLDTLKGKYKSVIEERDKQVSDYDKMLDEEIEFDGFKINLDNLPDELDSIFVEALLDTGLLNEPNELPTKN